MALMQLPPWLAINPQDYVNAVKAGSAIGIEIAQAQNRADELAAAQAARRWEFEQNARMKAAELEAEREKAAATIAATEKYRLAQQALESQRLGETQRYHDLQASIGQEANRIRALRGSGTGEKVYVRPDGEIIVAKPNPETGRMDISQVRAGQPRQTPLSASTAEALLSDPINKSSLDRTYGAGTTTNLQNVIRGSIDAAVRPAPKLGPPGAPVPITGAPVPNPGAPVPIPSSAAAAGAALAAPPQSPAAPSPARVPKIYFGSKAGEPPETVTPVQTEPDWRKTPIVEGEEIRFFEGKPAVFNSRTKTFQRWATPQ